MPDKVKIIIELDRDKSEEVRANLSEYLNDFYGPDEAASMVVTVEAGLGE